LKENAEASVQEAFVLTKGFRYIPRSHQRNFVTVTYITFYSTIVSYSKEILDTAHTSILNKPLPLIELLLKAYSLSNDTGLVTTFCERGNASSGSITNRKPLNFLKDCAAGT
jgi:hypothetical protein